VEVGRKEREKKSVVDFIELIFVLSFVEFRKEKLK